MRPFTLKTNIVASDKASKAFNKITHSAARMNEKIIKSAGFAGTAFGRFTQKLSFGARKAVVSLNNLNARVNRTFSNIGKKLGKIGVLGLGVGLLAIATTIANANIQLDASFASLSAITGKTGKAFEAFKVQVSEVAKEQRLFGADVAKGFEIVASAKPELLENAAALSKVTNAAITLSKASGDDLAISAQSLAGVMNQFSLNAEHAERVMNALAAGSVYGSANITNVAASMKNFGAVASAANISMEQSVALVEVMGSKSIFAEEAGTMLRSGILKLQQAGLGYKSGLFDINDALAEAKAKMDKLRTAKEKDAFLLKTFGARQITTGQILLNNVDKFNELTNSVTGTNTAVTQMNIKSNTFQVRLKEVSDAFKNSVSATDKQNKQMQFLKDSLVFVADNMDKIIAYTILAAKVFVLFKATVWGVNTGMKVYNKTLDIYRKVTNKATRAQWRANAAMLANPITWIVIAIIALIAAIGLLIYYWKDIINWIKTSDNWFAKLIRAAIFPLIIAFKTLGAIFDWISTKISQLIEWVKTSDNWFAKFLRGAINGLIYAFQIIGGVIDWVGSKFGELTEWIKTSDNWFAKFIRGAIDFSIKLVGFLKKIWNTIVEIVDYAFKAIGKLSEVIDYFSGETQKELGVKVTKESKAVKEVKQSIDVKTEDKKPGVIDKITSEAMNFTKALNDNSAAVDANTKSNQKQWKGKFQTTILKDMNIAQKDLAVSAVDNERNNQEIQNTIFRNKSLSTVISNQDVVDKNISANDKPATEVVTSGKPIRRKDKQNINGTITVNVVDKTGGKFGIQVEGTGIEVVTTGNK